MTHTPHEIAEEFPEFTAKIHDLKVSNPHFARCFEEYHELNRQVHRGETNVEPIGDVIMLDLRKKRLALKDEIYEMLKAE